MASTLEDAALGRAVRELAENADRARTFGLLFIVTKMPEGWHGSARSASLERPIPHILRPTLTELFTELAALIPDDKENADG